MIAKPQNRFSCLLANSHVWQGKGVELCVSLCIRLHVVHTSSTRTLRAPPGQARVICAVGRHRT